MRKEKKKESNRGKKASAPKRAATATNFEQFVEAIKTEIIEHFESNQIQLFKMQQLYDAFGVEDKKLRTLYYEIVQELIEDGKAIRNADGRYQWLSEVEQGAPTKVPEVPAISLKVGELLGRVDHVNANFAFIIVEGQEVDIQVFTEDMRSAMDGDTVKVKLTGREKGKHPIGKITEVVSHGRQQFVGVLEKAGRNAIVKPDNKRVYEPIEVVLKEDEHEIPFGTKVIVKITHWPTRTRPALGVIEKVLGKTGDNNTEMHAIMAEFELPVEFPAEVEEESKKIPDTIHPDELKGRRDFRSISTFTIDPVDAKDFDDALSIRYLENGNREVGIHIADVSHYILPGTELDKEAYRRATSVYLVDRTIPMLPEKLSNNLCSLRPNEDRLAFGAVFELTPEAKVVGQWFGRTIIHSDRRFSYEEAQEVLEAGQGDYAQELKDLNDMAKTLREERFANGAVNFETVEVKFHLDENGKPLGIYQKERKDAHKLIEEFMLLANKQVAEFVVEQSKSADAPNTMIYRIHEAPDPAKMDTFASFVARLGYKIEVGSEQKVARSLNKMLAKAEGTVEQNLIETLAVRTMAKARYSTEDIGHFGLAFRRYSHFTSPIRRYPDVIAHRLLQHYLDKGNSVPAEPIEAESKHCSERERAASEAERASIKYKQVEYMSFQDKDREYDGVISGVTEFGIFVEVTEMASEGLVRMNDLRDDYYELDKDNYRLIGERTGRIFGFGDPVRVKVSDVNLSRRSIDFVLVEEFSSSKPSRSHRGGSSRKPKPDSRRGGGRAAAKPANRKRR